MRPRPLLSPSTIRVVWAHVLLFLSELVSLRGAYDQAIAAAQRALTLATAGEAGVLSALANDQPRPDAIALRDCPRVIIVRRSTAIGQARRLAYMARYRGTVATSA